MFGALKATRRRFFGLAGAAPIAAKAAVDAEIGNLISPIYGLSGLGNASMNLPATGAPLGTDVPYTKRLIATADYFNLIGEIPECVEFTLRDNARYIGHLDTDIASKRSWSMAAKAQEQRQRNYDRALRRITEAGRLQSARNGLSAILGFEFPW